MAEGHGAVPASDERDRFRDRDLDGCAETAEVAIGVADVDIAGVAIDTDVLDASVQAQRGPRIGSEKGADHNGAESGARMDGERQTEPELEPVRRANVDSERQRLPVDCLRLSEEAVGPIRIGTVEGQIDLPLRQRDWTVDERLDVRGVGGSAAEHKDEQQAESAHRSPRLRLARPHGNT